MTLDQLAEIETEARRLARSGQYQGLGSIRTALKLEDSPRRRGLCQSLDVLGA